MKKIFQLFLILLLSFSLVGCSRLAFLTEGGEVIPGDNLSSEDINYIEELGLLDEDENIILFSSSLDHHTSGNFFSEKRVGHYWMYDKSPEDNVIEFTFFEEIEDITINYDRGYTYATAISIEIKDKSNDLVIYINGKRENEEDFYNKLLSEWKKHEKLPKP